MADARTGGKCVVMCPMRGFRSHRHDSRPRGRVLEDEQRAVVRFAIQGGAGADIIFAAGTTGEWDKIDNPRRQLSRES